MAAGARLARFAALGLAAIGLLWTAWILAAGGIDAEPFGVAISSHEPLRPLAVAAVGLVAYVYLDGTAAWHGRLEALGARVDDRLVAAVLSLGTAALGLTYATTVATGSDAYGYVSQADLWLERDLRVEQPWVAEVPWPEAAWTFTPLGYRPAGDGSTGTLVATYAAGLPLVMAAAKLVAGHAAVFWIGPIAGGFLVLATWGIGRRIGSSRAGLIGAWLVATSPAFLVALMFPMSDVPAAAAWAAAFWLMLVPGAAPAFGAGFAASVAILIRPNLAPAAVALVVWHLAHMARDGARWPIHARRAMLFVAGVVPGVLAVAAINRAIYESPLVSGYGSLDALFGAAHVWPNVWRYLGWIVETQTPLVLAGLAALAVPARRLWPFVTDRAFLAAAWLFSAIIVGQYLAYLEFDSWWFLRFLLPVWPFLMLGMGAVALGAARTGRPGIVLASLGLVVGLGLVQYRIGVNGLALDVWRGERRYVAAALEVARTTPERTVVFALQHSGSLRYYGGRVTMRYDLLDPGSLDRVVEWFAARGVGVYLLVEEGELADVVQRFANQRVLSRLAGPPIFETTGPLTTWLYDLSGGDRSAGRRIELDVDGLRAARPGPAPRLDVR